MSKYQSPKPLKSAYPEALAIAGIFTMMVLVGIPLTQLLSDTFTPDPLPDIDPIPYKPPVLEDMKIPPPQPPDKPKIDKIKEERPPLSIHQMEIDIAPDFGGFYDPSLAGIIPDMDTGDIVDWEDLTYPPKPLRQNRPVYPRDMRQADIEGNVWLEFVVNADGSTRDIRVLKSTNHAFNDAARRAVRQWLFQPGEKDGHPVNSRVRMQMPFRIH